MILIAYNCCCDVMTPLLLHHMLYAFMFKLPFKHESLLLDQKDQKLTQLEKRQAQQSYEFDKMKGGRPSVKSHSPPPPPPRRLYSPPPFAPVDHSDRFLLVSVNMLSAILACKNAVHNGAEIRKLPFSSAAFSHFNLIHLMFSLSSASTQLVSRLMMVYYAAPHLAQLIQPAYCAYFGCESWL